MTVEVARRVETARLVALIGALAIGLLSASGVVTQLLFSRPTTVKYAMTVAFACYLIIVICARKPLLVMTVVTALVAPFSATADFSGIQVTLGLLTLLPAVLVLLLNRVTPWQSVEVRRSSLAVAVPCMVAALAIPLLHANETLTWAVGLAAMLGTGWLVASVARSAFNRRTIAVALVIATAAQASIAIAEFISGRPFNLYSQAANYGSNYFYRYGNDITGFAFRPSAGMPDPNSLGNVLALGCPLVLALLMTVQNRKLQALLVGAGILNLIGLAVTLSRMSWIGAALGLILTVALLPGRKRLVAASVVVAGVVPAVVVALAVGGTSIADRFATVAEPTAATTETRQEDLTRVAIWETSIEVLSAHPFMGVGIDRLPAYIVAAVPEASAASHAHSTYLNIAAEAGVIGAAGLLFLVLAAAKDCFHGLRSDRALYAGVGGALLAMLTVWTTDYTIRSTPVALMFAAVIGLCAAARHQSVPR